MASELIALDSWTRSDNTVLYGIVTTGEDWRFGLLQRQQKKIVQDIERYLVPEQLYILLNILVSLLSSS